MNYEDKKKIIVDTLTLQVGLFNPKKSPKKDTDYQFSFNEPEGNYEFYLAIRNRTCKFIEGRAPSPAFHVITSVDTWNKIGGGYMSGKEAMKHGKLKIKGGVLTFLFKYKKLFSGSIDYPLPKNTYITPTSIEEIKRVLVLSCSPRREKGATHLMVEGLVAGMKKAGAQVDILFPDKMNVNPCRGCFQCWVNNRGECIYEGRDDMKQFFEEYERCDLVVWATPIYTYHCTTAMKNLMDRSISI